VPFNRYTISGGVIVLLVLANIISYLVSGWGLITVKVQDVPLRQVIKSIEWQGWVTIYTNLDPDTKISMWCDHVPLAEAMDTLATNIGGGPGGGPGGQNGTPPSSGNQGNVAGGNGSGDGGPRGRGRGFGRGAQWGLAFFVAPTTADAKTEIRSFQAGDTNDDAKVFHYPTPIQMLAGDEDFPAADPRLQAWPGVKASPPAPAPNPNAASADNAAPPAADIDPNSLQVYLKDFAQGADIWIMAPSAWNPNVAHPPAANSSIISAVKSLVGNARGAVIQAIVLRSGRGGGGMRGFAIDDDAGWSDMTDRLRNDINGLPEEARPQALSQLDVENQFRQQVIATPQDQRQQMIREHMVEKMANNMKRMTPEKRAQRYQRMVAARIAAKGQQ